jgi:hypothetical protein
MLKQSVLALLLLAVATTAYADTFQLMRRSGQDTYRVANAPIAVFDSKGQRRFSGYTDRTGRFFLVILPKGTYLAKVTYGQATLCATLVVTGNQAPRQVFVNGCQ